MTTPLTATAVKNARPSVTRRELPDGACPGLHLTIEPSGSKRWALRYRRPDGRPARLVLGSVHAGADAQSDEPVIGGHHTLAAARRLVAALRHEIAQGRDQQARLLGFRPDDLDVIRGGLAERWADKPVAEITGHDIHLLIDETRQRGAPGLERRADGPTEGRARAMFGCLSKLFKWLLQHRRIESNPCVGVHRPETPQSRDRVLTNAEIVKFWQATETEPSAALLKMLLLTGCRLNEVAGMRRSELSDDCAIWNIPGTRTKNRRPHTVPLPPLARQLIGKSGATDLLFTTTGTTPVSGWTKVKRRLDRAMQIPPWRLHDLRRSFVTGMAELGIRPDVIELAVNHVSGVRGGIAGVYNRSELLPERRAALERWAVHVEALVAGQAAKVVPIRA